MNTLELFCGTKSFSKVARERGHKTLTLDIDPRFEPDICDDAMEFVGPEYFSGHEPFDIIWASPPCQCFSVASIGTHWRGGWRKYEPATYDAEQSCFLVLKTLEIIDTMKPGFWFIENPRGVLRKMDFMRDVPRKTAWYCQYGDERAKPTDIWTNLDSWVPKTCRNGSPDHESAPRGSKTGTQGRKGAVERAIVPRRLCEEILIACEGSMT